MERKGEIGDMERERYVERTYQLQTTHATCSSHLALSRTATLCGPSHLQNQHLSDTLDFEG